MERAEKPKQSGDVRDPGLEEERWNLKAVCDPIPATGLLLASVGNSSFGNFKDM